MFFFLPPASRQAGAGESRDAEEAEGPRGDGRPGGGAALHSGGAGHGGAEEEERGAGDANPQHQVTSRVKKKTKKERLRLRRSSP